MNHLLSLASIEQADFQRLIERSCDFARDAFPGGAPLAGRSIGIEFRAASTRTRTSFAAAAARLGATPIIYGHGDLQTNSGETPQDTVRVLAGYLEMLILRSAGDPAELRLMAAADVLPIINAMSADEHPTQALSDIAVLRRRFGQLAGTRLLYNGEGNNTAVALAYAVSRTAGMQADFRTPAGYGLARDVMEKARELGRRYGGSVSQSHNPPSRVDANCANFVYATRWQTTGTTKAEPVWRERFRPFCTDAALMDILSRDGTAIFLHDLPAVRGEECTSAVLDGPRSIAFEQADQKLFTAMAIIEWCAWS